MGHPLLTIVAVSGGLGALAGFVMHRSDFCVAGMFRDWFLFRDASMLRMLALLVVTSAVLFQSGATLGWIRPGPFPLLGAASLATLLAGVLFGVGMVLAGGCVVGSLYKFGAGSLLSGVALVGMLAGSALYAEFHPAWSAFARATTLFDGAATLPVFFGVSPAALVWPAAVIGALVLARSYRARGWQRPSYVDGYIQPWTTALVLAGIGFVSYALVGMPLGITTSYAKLGANVESWFAPAHVASLSYFVAQPLSYTPPLSSVTVRGGAGPGFDAVAAIQYPIIVGVIMGAALSALRLGEFRIYYRVPAGQYLSALTGGLLVGMAARMTPGCNIWHLWGGLPILATQSLVFLCGIVPGAWIGSRLLAGVVLRVAVVGGAVCTRS